MKKLVLAVFFVVFQTACVPNPDLEMMGPTVVVSTKEGLGTGVVIEVKDNWYTVLTAKHVVKEYKNVVITPVNGKPYLGKVVKFSFDRDLALVKVYIKDYSITPTKTCLEPVGRFEEVWSVGAGLGFRCTQPKAS